MSADASATGASMCCSSARDTLVNHKKLFRLYREEKLTVRRRGGRKRAIGTRAPMLIPMAPNERWSLDFVSDQLTDGRRFRILTVVDDCTRECLALVADTSLSGAAGGAGTRPAHDRTRQAQDDCQRQRQRTHQQRHPAHGPTRPGSNGTTSRQAKPIQNGFIESFNGRLRDEFLNETLFASLAQARAALERWRADYNNSRPHSKLGWKTPTEFATMFPPRSRAKPTAKPNSELNNTWGQVKRDGRPSSK